MPRPACWLMTVASSFVALVEARVRGSERASGIIEPLRSTQPCPVQIGFLALAGSLLTSPVVAQGSSSALLYDGTDDFAIASSNPDFGLQQGLTLEAWENPTTLGPNENIVTRQSTAGQFAPWSFTIEVDMLRLWIQSSDVNSVPGLVPNQVQHVAVTWTPGTGAVVFFRNGVVLSTATAQPSLPQLSYNVVVGGLSGAPTWSLDGTLDEVRIWDRVRSPAEVLTTSCRRLTPQETADPSLIAYWPMDAGTGQFALDQSSHSHSLQLGATPTVDMFDPLWVAESLPTSCQTYCFGTACPCNNNDASAGCANGSGQGCLLSMSGSNSISQSDLILHATSTVPHQPGLFFQGDNAINGGNGSQFGDGLRCAGGSVVRLQVRTADGNGSASTTVGIAAKGGVSPGDTKRYQWWHRDPTGSPCGTGFNLSNGL